MSETLSTEQVEEILRVGEAVTPGWEHVQALSSLATELLALRKRVEWQDISTAPKDGTVFLGYEPHNAVSEMRWEAYDPDDAYDVGDEGYWSYTVAVMCDTLEPPEPTHWQPLPASPPPHPQGAIMSDAIEAAAKALISAQRDMFPGGGWFALDDAKTLVIAALTAYEAAKGGGVAWRYFTRRHMPGHHDSGGEVVVPFSNDDEMAAIHAALTSPASGERDAVIDYTKAAERLLRARPFGDATIGKYLGLEDHPHSTAVMASVLRAALRMEGK